MRTPHLFLVLWLAFGFVTTALPVFAQPAFAQPAVADVAPPTQAPSAAERALSAAKTFVHGDFTVLVGEQRFTHKRIDWGATVDVAALTRTYRISEAAGQSEPPPVSASVDKQTLWDALIAIKDAVDTKPVPARFDPSTGSLRKAQAGINLSLRQTFGRIAAAMRFGDKAVEAAFENLAPPALDADSPALAANAFSEKVAMFSTSYDGRKRNRTFNLRVATDKIDGTLLQPGEIFDFNDRVGERSETNGFRVAPVIASGELVDGIGGGTCQVSGTLHAAVFFAGFEILERKPHSRPSSYIKLGLDAAVSYPNLNFRFRNTLDKPVAIAMRVEGGRVHAEVFAAQRGFDVTFRREITELIPFKTESANDPSLPEGVRVLRQRGTPGFRVLRTREIQPVSIVSGEPELLAAAGGVVKATPENAASAIEEEQVEPSKTAAPSETVADSTTAAGPSKIEEVEDYYPPTTEIWAVGTGAPAGKDYTPPAGDTHGEYTADAKLVMRFDADSMRFVEQKTLGVSGRSGWSDGFRADGKGSAKP